MTTHTNPAVWHLTVLGPSGEMVLADWLFSDFDRAADAAVQQIGTVSDQLDPIATGADVSGEHLLRAAGFEFTETTGWIWQDLNSAGDAAIIVKEREVL